jgi:hypothetical protein
MHLSSRWVWIDVQEAQTSRAWRSLGSTMTSPFLEFIQIHAGSLGLTPGMAFDRYAMFLGKTMGCVLALLAVCN